MIWISLILAILPLVIKLIQWLVTKKQSGEGLTEYQQSRLNSLLEQTRKLDDLAVSMGCAPSRFK